MRMVFLGGKIYTGQLPLQEAFVVEDDRFVFAGSADKALEFAKSDDKIIDLKGKFVCAGFIF